MQIRSLFAVVLAFALPALGQGPGGGGFNPGGGGNQPGGGGGSFSYDSLASNTTNADFTVHRTAGGLLYRLAAAPTAVAPPAAVAAIADGLFAGCATLTSADLSSTAITALPSDCFAGCTALTTVVLPDTCTAIGPNAFAGCTALASVTAPAVASVAADAFRDCTSLASLPSFAPSAALGPWSFSQSGLASLDLSAVAPTNGTFAGCASLASAAPAPEDLPPALFSGCTALSFDPSVCTNVGQAALAGVPYGALSVPLAADFSPYAFAADRATAETLLTDPDAEWFDECGIGSTVFLGRALSYDTGNGYARVEAASLVRWLEAQTIPSPISPVSPVVQPASYATANLETWLADIDNLYAYTSASLTVSGNTFLFTPPSAQTTSVRVAVESTTDLLDSDSWAPGALDLDPEASTPALLVYTTTNTPAFARLAFSPAW